MKGQQRAAPAPGLFFLPNKTKVTKRKNQWPLRAADGTEVTIQDMRSFCADWLTNLRAIDPATLPPDPHMPGRERHTLSHLIAKAEMWSRPDFTIKVNYVNPVIVDAAAEFKKYRPTIARTGRSTPRPAPATPSRPVVKSFNDAVEKLMAAGWNRPTAIEMVRREQPELFNEYVNDGRRQFGAGR